MRTRTIISALVLLLSSSLLANDSAILHIRKEYQAIQSALPTLKMESIELHDYSTEGGEAKIYRDSKGNIQLIKVVLFFESGKVFEEYYYRNSSLIFVFHKNHRYNVPYYITPETAKKIGGESFDPQKTKTTENRYYFNNRKMILWLNADKKEVNIKSKEFIDTEKQILNFSNELFAKVRQKN